MYYASLQFLHSHLMFSSRMALLVIFMVSISQMYVPESSRATARFQVRLEVSFMECWETETSVGISPSPVDLCHMYALVGRNVVIVQVKVGPGEPSNSSTLRFELEPSPTWVIMVLGPYGSVQNKYWVHKQASIKALQGCSVQYK
jgi:hypothetical protein